MIKHHCHAIGCERPCPPKMFMCLMHWKALPRDHQRQIWSHYRPGQEDDKQPTMTYRIVAEQAKIALAEKLGVHASHIQPHRDVLAWLQGQPRRLAGSVLPVPQDPEPEGDGTSESSEVRP